MSESNTGSVSERTTEADRKQTEDIQRLLLTLKPGQTVLRNLDGTLTFSQSTGVTQNSSSLAALTSASSGASSSATSSATPRQTLTSMGQTGQNTSQSRSAPTSILSSGATQDRDLQAVLTAIAAGISNSSWSPPVMTVDWACTGRKLNMFFRRYEAYANSLNWTDGQLAKRCQYYCDDSVADGIRTFCRGGVRSWGEVKKYLQTLYHKGDEYEEIAAEFDSESARMREDETANEYVVRFNKDVTNLNEARLEHNRSQGNCIGFAPVSTFEKNRFFLERINRLHWEKCNERFNGSSNMEDIVNNMQKRERVQRLQSQQIKKGIQSILNTVTAVNLGDKGVKQKLQALITGMSATPAASQSSGLSRCMSLLRGPPVSQVERTLKELTKTWASDPEQPQNPDNSVALENEYARKLQMEMEKERRKHATALKQVKAAHDTQRLNMMNSTSEPSPMNSMRASQTNTINLTGDSNNTALPRCLACRNTRNDHDMYHCDQWCHICGGKHLASACTVDWKTLKCTICNGKHNTNACLMRFTGTPDYIESIKGFRDKREIERMKKKTQNMKTSQVQPPDQAPSNRGSGRRNSRRSNSPARYQRRQRSRSPRRIRSGRRDISPELPSHRDRHNSRGRNRSRSRQDRGEAKRKTGEGEKTVAELNPGAVKWLNSMSKFK